MNKPTSSSTPLPALPKSWSELTWQQLCDCWQVKMRYGRNADVARVAALLQALGASGWRVEPYDYDPLTGEKQYLLVSRKNRDARWVCTARELAYMAKQAMPWFDYPYGDPGEKEEKDEKGKVIKERREGVRGYVSGMRDAMMLPQERFKVQGSRFKRPLWFQLPQAACANLTWEQYRALQNITPQLFAEGNTDEQRAELQAQFLAHILTPRSFAIFDTTGGNIKIRPHWVYEYNSHRAESLVAFWRKRLTIDHFSPSLNSTSPLTIGRRNNVQCSMFNVQCLFSICFQVYQTALMYYEASYPLLFTGGGKQDPLRDALTGEVGTINTVMKYAGYASQQEVYDSNLPFILDILNTMSKEAKELEKIK